MIRKGRVTIGGAGLAAIAAVGLLLTSGCGYGGVASAANHPDLTNGQKLFSTAPPGGPACASCHSLQAAGSHGTVGPNLDNAFAESVIQGYGQSSIENVVLDQIRLGSGPVATYTKGEHGVTGMTPQPQMPANLWTGQNAIDIAAYVASVAGTSGYVTGNLGTNGAAIFKGIGCAGCHVLKAAGSTGTTGPNLDQLASQLTLAIVTHQVTVGGAPMPAFKGTLTPAQIKAVAQYVISVAGK